MWKKKDTQGLEGVLYGFIRLYMYYFLLSLPEECHE